MPAHVRAALSAGAHALVVWLAAVAVAHGIDIPAKWSGWLETVLLAAVFAAYAGLVHWLSSRKGDGGWPKTARFLGKLLTLGAGALTPAPKPLPAAAAHLRAQADARRAVLATGRTMTPQEIHDALVRAARQSVLRRKGRELA